MINKNLKASQALIDCKKKFKGTDTTWSVGHNAGGLNS